MLKLIEKNKKMKKDWNHLVDTNQKIIGNERWNKTKNLISIEKYELYTTRHEGSAQDIYDYISKYLSSAKRPRIVATTPDNLVDSPSHHEE